MSIESLINRPATLITVTDGQDGWGNTIPVESSKSVVCELQQRTRDEVPNPGTWQVGVYRLFLLKSETVAGADRIVVDGVTYEFDGPPELVRNPRTQSVSHWEATVKLAT